MVDRNHPWRRSMRLGTRYPESAQALDEKRIDERVADLLRRLGPLSCRDLGRRLDISHQRAGASVQRLKCIQEGSGTMTRWRLPGTERKDEEHG